MTGKISNKLFAAAKSLAPAVLLGIIMVLQSPTLRAESSSWLMKINDAAATTSFAGTFVYVRDHKVEAMEVVRRIKNGVMQERLYALNGEAREIVRDMNQVWCYIPDQNVAVHDYRQASESGFPRILPKDLALLTTNYRFEMGKMSRIADRQAQQVNVIPKDSYRYGYSLWADTQTGLLLRSDLLDQSGNLIEQYVFVKVQIGGEIKDEQLAAVTQSDQFELYGNSGLDVSAPADKSQWFFESLPSGYSMSRHMRRMSPMESNEVEHMVFSDGLSTVSVFIKPARQGQSGMKGLSRLGSVHTYRDTVSDHRITVMGEVPAETVKMLAQNISIRP
ncbi:MAG: MucB/RseB C-terminal domain-containing protein [Pseudomonadota bacterium]